jgi:hypothetical protein
VSGNRVCMDDAELGWVARAFERGMSRKQSSLPRGKGKVLFLLA